MFGLVLQTPSTPTLSMSSPPPPAGSPPATGSKRRISLPNSSSKKHKPSRKPSLVGAAKPNHPLRQTSFPPEEDPGRGDRSPSIASSFGGGEISGSVQLPGRSASFNGVGTAVAGSSMAVAGEGTEGPGGNEEEDEEDRGDDYGTTSLLADGGIGGFGEDDERKIRIAALVEHFDEDQLNRYECYRRSNLNKAAVKKIANQVLSQSVTANVGTVIGGFAKVYVCDIVQSALDIQKEWGDEGPLLPDHLREAARRYRCENQGALGNRYVGGTHTGPGPGAGEGFGGGVTRLFR